MGDVIIEQFGNYLPTSISLEEKLDDLIKQLEIDLKHFNDCTCENPIVSGKKKNICMKCVLIRKCWNIYKFAYPPYI